MTKRIKKKILGIAVILAKKIPLTRYIFVKSKQAILRYIDEKKSQQEIYNLSSFYPTINEYYRQQQDSPRKGDPLISILLPLYNTPEVYLRECIESIMMQSYPKWELCIADDCSPDSNVLRVAKEYEKKDSRIKIIERKENGHISKATNSALSIATGEFVALMDHDDVLWPNALYEVVSILRNFPDTDFIYSDEDKIDSSGKVHSYPFLKPDFNIEFLESCNYITHFSCIRTSIMRRIKGFKEGTEGAQDWDLFLRVSGETSNIVHIGKILYSWRVHEASTASDTDAKPYVYEAQKKLLEDYLISNRMKGKIETGIIRQHRTIKYKYKSKTKLEVIIGVTEPINTEALIKTMQRYPSGADISITYLLTEANEKKDIQELHNRHISDISASFELGSLNNYILKSTSNFLCYISDDVNIGSSDWASLILGEITRKGVGYVGPVLMYKTDNTIASAGLGIGYGSNKTYLDMLEGMPFEDPHYTRGLYAKSRRDVTAVNPVFFGMSLQSCRKYIKKSRSIIESMVLTTKSGHRVVYTPYIVGRVDSLKKIGMKDKIYEGFEDPMLNPNFKKDNQRMEVRY